MGRDGCPAYRLVVEIGANAQWQVKQVSSQFSCFLERKTADSPPFLHRWDSSDGVGRPRWALWISRGVWTR
jgi:hypothetical protein